MSNAMVLPVQNLRHAIYVEAVDALNLLYEPEALVDSCAHTIDPIRTSEEVEARVLILVPELSATTALMGVATRVQPANQDVVATRCRAEYAVFDIRELSIVTTTTPAGNDSVMCLSCNSSRSILVISLKPLAIGVRQSIGQLLL
jgi:hypothetical protein